MDKKIKQQYDKNIIYNIYNMKKKKNQIVKNLICRTALATPSLLKHAIQIHNGNNDMLYSWGMIIFS